MVSDSDPNHTSRPEITVCAADSHSRVAARDVALSAELWSGMRVKLTMTGENYSVTAWVPRKEWDDIVREMS